MNDDVYTPIIVPEDIGRLAWPCDADRTVAERAIEEAVLMDIRPKIGSELYLRLAHGVQYGLLLDGGEYTAYPCDRRAAGPRDKRAGGGIPRSFGGLRRAAAYYAYGRIVRQGGVTVTRFGVVRKKDDYSEKADAREVLNVSDRAFEMADMYMKECLVYMRDNPDLFPDYHGGGQIRQRATRYRVIGD